MSRLRSAIPALRQLATLGSHSTPGTSQALAEPEIVAALILQTMTHLFLFAGHLASQQVGLLVGRGLPLVCTASSSLWSPGLLPGLSCARTLATAGSSGKADQPKDKASSTASQACGGLDVRESHVLATGGGM